MSYNGSGTFNINTAGQPVVTGTVISSTAFNALTSDLGTGLSTAITKDGQTTATARIPFAAGINSSLVTDATSTTTGSIITAGGVGIAKALYVGTTLNVAGASTLAAITGTFNGTVGATTPSTGAFTTLSASGTTNIGGSSRTTDKFTVKNTTTNEWAASVVSSGANASESLGLLIIAGTNNIDFALKINSQAGSALMNVSGSGIATMNAYGAGAATFSAAGVISSVSDETWKVKDGAPVDTDAMLNKLEPGYWYYNDEKKDTFGADRQLGFYAQNVNAAIGPEAAPEPETIVTKNDDGTETSVTKPWGYYDRSVLAVTVMSLQKALATIESLTARITALEAK